MYTYVCAIVGQTALMLAAMKGHKECMINLLNRDAKIDLRSKNGFTALILAAQRYRHECIYILLQNGANVNAVADNGMTALHAAAIKNDADCTKVLLYITHICAYIHCNAHKCAHTYMCSCIQTYIHIDVGVIAR